jgi:micrococcal nuclease
MRCLPALLLAVSCSAPVEPSSPPEGYTDDHACGPAAGFVEHVIDGDTIRLDTEETIRYLLVDTPETTKGLLECYGVQARAFNEDLVLGQEVRLFYDVECRDKYDRLLAYVEVPDGVVNELLLVRGYAELMHIPPNGAEHLAAYADLERFARDNKIGQWGACPQN